MTKTTLDIFSLSNFSFTLVAVYHNLQKLVKKKINIYFKDFYLDTEEDGQLLIFLSNYRG